MRRISSSGEVDRVFLWRKKELLKLIIRRFIHQHLSNSDNSLKINPNDKPVAQKIQNEEDKEKDKLKNSLNDAIVRDKPNVKWEDIAGLENAKKSLREAVILPIKFPEIFVGQRKPWKGILLYGVFLIY